MIPRRALVLASSVLLATVVAGCSNGSATSSSPPTIAGSAPTTAGAPTTTSSSSSSSATSTKPAPVATESNPPGDIPDNQAFVAYSPAGSGFSIKVPEGWSRATRGTATTFTDKLNRIEVSSAPAASAPTVQQVTASVVPSLQKSVPQFAAGKVATVKRQAGGGVLVTYQGDSATDQVTGKVIRDAFEQYLFFHNGRLVTLTLVGPTNADNVDPWRIVSDSLRWA